MRVAILGNAGSGKSTLARALAAAANVPVLDLDTAAWEPDQPAVQRPESLARDEVDLFCRNHRHWIVEGCYTSLIEAALVYGPRLIFLNPGLEACVANCRSRPWETHKYRSKEEQDRNLEFLLSWVADYYVRSGPLSLTAHRDGFEAYLGPKREFRSALDVQRLDPEFLAWVG